MATHPFAIKLENAIEHAKRVRDALLAAKKSAGEQEQEVDRLPHKAHKPRFVQLGAIAASGMERQADVQAGEANNSFGRVAGEMRVDKTMRALQIKLAQEEGKCARARALLIRDSGREVSYPCPGATAARQALADYMLRTYGDTQYGVANSGGGGGGGW